MERSGLSVSFCANNGESTMSFTFNCPHCQQKIEAEDEWIGQDAECPSCGKTIKVEKNKPQIILKPINPQPGFQQQPGFQPQTFVQNTPKEPASPSSFSYQRIGNKFYAIGDYPTLFALINEFCSRSGLQVEKSDINQGCITIKYNFLFTQFVFFYQEADKIVIEATSNAIVKFQFAINKQLSKLVEAIEAGFHQYKNGQYIPNNCYNALLPQAYQKAEIDYTSVAKALTWYGPLLTVVVPFGFFPALVLGIICLVKIYSTKDKKGQEFVYISFGADIVGLIFNAVLFDLLFG